MSREQIERAIAEATRIAFCGQPEPSRPDCCDAPACPQPTPCEPKPGPCPEFKWAPIPPHHEQRGPTVSRVVLPPASPCQCNCQQLLDIIGNLVAVLRERS